MSETQYELFRKTHQQEFDDWKELPGAKLVLHDIFRITAGYVPQWKRTGIPVSNALVWETMRHRIKHVMARAKVKKVKSASLDGYTLNNNMRASMARFVMERRPDWQGVFELRELGSDNKPKRAVVVAIKERVG